VTSSPPNQTERLVAVAVPVPGLGLLSYRLTGNVAPTKGARVRVPLGARSMTGCIVDIDVPHPEGAALRDLTEILDARPFLPPLIVDLALWVGEYYAAGPGAALAIAMPPAARRGETTTFRMVRVAMLTDAGGDAARARGTRQREAIAHLRGRPEGIPLPELAKLGIGLDTVKALVSRQLVRIREDEHLRDPFADDEEGGGGRWTLARSTAPAPALTPEQARVFRHLEEAAASGTFRTALLHGVTGSGKTEIYLQLAKQVLARGRRVLILVPEIALTPSVVGQFRARFGGRVAIQHSALSTGERHDQWHRIRRGDIDVVVGTRSAVFAPLEHLGLIVVDEEHESAYKQEEAPRYNGRDVAVVRGRMERALVVLGSATPSLESAVNARSGRYEALALTQRIMDRPLAAVRIVDMRREYAAHGADVTLSAPLVEAIDTRLSRGEQSLVLLNRRGFATVIFCRQCGASLECPHCSVALTFHRAQRRVRCHYCNYAAAVPKRCGACGGEFLEQAGFGTERLEADLASRFPGARIVRVDRDTIRRRGAIARVLRDVERGAIDVLVGTQMIAKGHDFPAVTLVGVVSADVGLGLADFRAAERTFQLLTQVVGRAGRGDVPGEAIVQTLYPDHYAVRAAAAQDYGAFFERELTFRTSLHYPPVVALINVVVKGRTLEGAMTDAHDLVKRIRVHGPRGSVIGPAPAPLSKIKDEYRAQFFLKGAHRRPMRQALERAFEERPESRRRALVDVDPVGVL